MRAIVGRERGYQLRERAHDHGRTLTARQKDAESAPLAGGAGKLNFTTERLHGVLDDRQAQPGSADVA
jgi:hypothetical protein